jgi:hypothetical protein
VQRRSACRRLVWECLVHLLPGTLRHRWQSNCRTDNPAGRGQRIQRRDPAGLGADDIVAGPDGNVWFAASSGHVAIDRVTPSGEVSEFDKGLVGAPSDLVAGPDGNVWFTAQQSIGRVTPSGEITHFTDCMNYRQLFSEATSIVAGPGEDLWFASVTSRQLPSIELHQLAIVLPRKRTIRLPSGPATRTTAATCGPAQLRLRLRGATKTRLRRKGRVEVKIRATFTPTGGSANTQVATILLREQRPRS